MAARNKRSISGTSGGTARDPIARTSPALHMRASRHRDDLLEEAHELMAEGKVREARAVERRAGQVAQLVGALEAEIRPDPRPREQRDNEA